MLKEKKFNPQPENKPNYRELQIVKHFVAEILKLYSADKIKSYRHEEQRTLNGVPMNKPDGTPKMYKPNFAVINLRNFVEMCRLAALSGPQSPRSPKYGAKFHVILA